MTPFLVTCHGWSGSKWVAFALNRHADIACGHTSAGLLAVEPTEFDVDVFDTLLPIARAGYLERLNRPMAEVYADLAAQKPSRFTGTVHTYRLRDLPGQATNFPTKLRYPTLNLIRHPLNLVVSGYGQFQDLFRADLNEFAWTLGKLVDRGMPIVEDICARHAIKPGEFDHVCFLSACVVLSSLRLDLDAVDQITPDSPWDYRGMIRMEDVTTSPDAFADLVARLTGDPTLADPAYLDAVFELGAINRHNRHAKKTTQDRWNALTNWQRDAFTSFLSHFDLRSAYERFGYDFSFIDEAR